MTIALHMPRIGSQIKGAPITWVTGALFFACFAPVLLGLLMAWMTLPEAAHGILIAPVAVWLAWRSGIIAEPQPARWLGSAIVLTAVVGNLFGRVAGVETIPRAAFLLGWGNRLRQLVIDY